MEQCNNFVATNAPKTSEPSTGALGSGSVGSVRIAVSGCPAIAVLGSITGVVDVDGGNGGGGINCCCASLVGGATVMDGKVAPAIL